MVRRGSTVRVRQRALQKPRTLGFLARIDLLLVEHAVGVEHVVEQSAFEEPSRPILQWSQNGPLAFARETILSPDEGDDVWAAIRLEFAEAKLQTMLVG
jgi:hypothetical protein